MIRETSAGGLVHRDGKLLMVRVCSLKGDKVWTFPKGHIEQGEQPLDAALREVEEETGWRCSVVGPLMTARYSFSRSKGKVSKTVRWFLMEPEKKVGEPDADEVLAAKWVSLDDIDGFLKYPSDIELVKSFREKKAL